VGDVVLVVPVVPELLLLVATSEHSSRLYDWQVELCANARLGSNKAMPTAKIAIRLINPFPTTISRAPEAEVRLCVPLMKSTET
jgi:hypothetical protein